MRKAHTTRSSKNKVFMLIFGSDNLVVFWVLNAACVKLHIYNLFYADNGEFERNLAFFRDRAPIFSIQGHLAQFKCGLNANGQAKLLKAHFQKLQQKQKSPRPVRAEGLFLKLCLRCRLASRRGFEPLLPP